MRFIAILGSIALASAGIALGCVPTRGGWDVEALRRSRPALAALEGQRLGDMVPFPALALVDGEPERVALVVCRFEAPAAIRVRTGGPGWAEATGAKALAALVPALESFGLTLRRVDSGPAEVTVDAFVEGGDSLPEGLGDTLVECDVAPRTVIAVADAGAGGGAEAGVAVAIETNLPRVRGKVLRAEIRMRRSGRDAAGRPQVASDEAWTGALLHELGHALGYAGHAAVGESILVRDEFRLRAIGRAVLRGAPLADATLAALHQLEPGEKLGARELPQVGADWVRALRALDRAWIAAGGERVAVIATVGDREARWSLRYADGRRLGLRFPAWPDRLREGREILVVPERETLEAIRGSPRGSLGIPEARIGGAARVRGAWLPSL